MSIYKKRKNYKPFEYPRVKEFTDAMSSSYWVESEVDFGASIQDYHTMDEVKREIFIRAILTIAQVEVEVKAFWGDLYRHFPKPEFNNLGATFAESECRHSEAYSKTLEVLGIEDRFLELLEIPAFKRKLKMIENIMGNPEVTIESKLLFFTLVIENSSLFSYFAIGTSFARFEGKMKNLTNMINWSAIDESLHGEAGIWLINEIRKEKDIFEGLDMKAMVEEYVEVESEMLDWIFEQGQLKYFTKEDLLNYIKYRLDMSFVKIGLNKTYNITNEQLAPMNWFEEQVFGERSDDFFAIRPVDYTKHDKSFTGDDLF